MVIAPQVVSERELLLLHWPFHRRRDEISCCPFETDVKTPSDCDFSFWTQGFTCFMDYNMILFEISLTKRETLRSLQSDHFVTEPNSCHIISWKALHFGSRLCIFAFGPFGPLGLAPEVLACLRTAGSAVRGVFITGFSLSALTGPVMALLLSLLFIVLQFIEADCESVCSPCVTREVRDGEGNDVCSRGAKGVCKLIRSCEVDRTARLAFAVPFEIKCLDDRSQVLAVSAPRSLSVTVPSTVPTMVRTAGSLTAIQTALSGASTSSVFGGPSGRITLYGDLSQPRQVLHPFSTFKMFKTDFIPATMTLGAFTLQRTPGSAFLTTRASKKQITVQQNIMQCRKLTSTATLSACVTASLPGTDVSHVEATAKTFSVASLESDLSMIGLPGAAVQRLAPARLCYTVNAGLDILMQSSNVVITYSFPGNRFTVVAGLEESVAGGITVYQTCFLLPIFSGNIVSGTQYSVNVVSIDYVYVVLQPAVHSTIANPVLLQWATTCRLTFPPTVVSVFGLPMNLLVYDVTGTVSQTLDLSTYVGQTFVDLPVTHDSPYASLALVPAPGHSTISATAIYQAFGLRYPGDAAACLMTATCTGGTYAKVATGATDAACCEIRPTYAIDVRPLAGVSDGVLMPISMSPTILGGRWNDDDSAGVLQYREDVVGVPELVSISGSAHLLVLHGVNAHVFGMIGTWRLSTEVNFCLPSDMEAFEVSVVTSHSHTLAALGTLTRSRKVKVIALTSIPSEVCTALTRTPVPPLNPLSSCPTEMVVSEACLLGKTSSDVSLFVADVFLPLSKKRISKKLISETDAEDPEESDVLLQSLKCVYASAFKPWSDIVGGMGLQSAYQQLSTSEQAMATDETPFRSTFGLSILTAAIHAHAGHFAIPSGLSIPSPMDDDFLRQTTDFVFSRGNDLLVAKSVMTLDDDTLFRDDLKVLAQGSHFGGLTEDLPGLFCIFDLSLAYDHVDPALADRPAGETTDSLCKSYNVRFGAKSTSPDLTSLAKSVGCRSSIGLVSNQASNGQALTGP